MNSRYLPVGSQSSPIMRYRSAGSQTDGQPDHFAPRYHVLFGGEQNSHPPADGSDTTERGPGHTETTIDSGDRASPGGAPNSGETDGSSDRTAGPGWLSDDGIVGDQPDRQVLVVGDGVVGLTLALSLQRAGYDPLVTTGRDRRTQSRVSYLWASTARVLESLGVGETLSECGVAIDAVSVGQPGSRYGCRVLRTESETGGSSPTVVRTGALRAALEAQLSGEKTVRDLSVDELGRQEGGVLVEFESGVREWFDVVVGAGAVGIHGSPAEQQPREYDRFVQYEMPVEADGAGGTQAQESWHPERLVQRVPIPNSSDHLLRITTSAAPPPDTNEQESQWSVADGTEGRTLPGRDADLPESLSPLDRSDSGPDPPGDPEPAWADITRESVRQARLPVGETSAVREWWGTDRVAFCGAAACPLAPATGCRVAFGVEDAVAFVTALARNPESVKDAVAEYAADRARRYSTLRRRASLAGPEHEYPLPSEGESPLGALGLVRTVALGPFLGPNVNSIQRDGIA